MADSVPATFVVDDIMQLLIVPPSRVKEAFEDYRNLFDARLLRLEEFDNPPFAFAEVQLGGNVFGITDFPFNVNSQVIQRVYSSDVNALLANAKKLQFVLVENCSALVGGGVILENRFHHLWQVSGADQDLSSGTTDPGSSSPSSHVTVTRVTPVLIVDEEIAEDDQEDKIDWPRAHVAVENIVNAFKGKHLRHCRFPQIYGVQPGSSLTQAIIDSDYFGCSELKIGPATMIVRDKTNLWEKNTFLELECLKIADAKEIIIKNNWTILRDIQEDRFHPGVLLLTVMDPFNHIWQLCHSSDGLGDNGYLSQERLKVLVMARTKRDADDTADSLIFFFGTPRVLTDDVHAVTSAEGFRLAKHGDYDVIIARDDISGIANIEGTTTVGLISDGSDMAAAAKKLDFVSDSKIELTGDQISKIFIHALRKRHRKRKEKLEAALEVQTEGT